MNKANSHDLAVRPIAAAETRPLRHALLRPHQPWETCVYAGDEAEDTLHVGAFSGNRLVGIATFLRQPPPEERDPGAWRLRGMAVISEARRQGHGRALVEAGLRHVARNGGTRLWFNARTSAAPFYRALGFKTQSEVFDLPPIGPHVVMEQRTERSRT